jgi:hypothetical protein
LGFCKSRLQATSDSAATAPRYCLIIRMGEILRVVRK